ncbi:hypothetical protein TrVE_jg6132 [Triparma verrucosa]|uniref:Cytosol aminopeptidase domain-containing protein n=1 Tax=Triparma verrucosa TaxID=1606542 RepID=A0A9W7C2Y3_9STRA|nr:hypothetical protein TrVE_jg6132 [Triparma verrucosa]
MEVNDLHKADIRFVDTASTTENAVKVKAVYGAEEDTTFELPSDTADALKNLFEVHSDDFKNGTVAGTSLPVVTLSNNDRLTVVSLGSEKNSKGNKSAATKLAATLARLASAHKAATIIVEAPEEFTNDKDAMKAFTTGLYGALYTDNRYRFGDNAKDPFSNLSTIEFVSTSSSASSAVELGTMLETGASLTRDLVNSPPNVLNPLSMASVAKKIAAESGGCMKAKIMDARECESMGMGAYLGVARGSETEPQFIHLTYTPPNKSNIKRKLAVVGKGLTFDAGGYNIKLAMMELMKFDMGGSGATLGAAKAISLLKPENVEIHFIIASCENMINEKAMRPGDILTASNGKTIEVLNTDAEGRLTLADALVYADKTVNADKIIDLATLTGACMVALGDGVAGVWSSDDDLASALVDSASSESGDKTWRMPLEASYNDQLKSKIADMTNLGGKYGGAITAALFLQNFVDKKKPYAHIDIAGPVWDNKKGGATGFGAKLVSEWLLAENDDAGK